MAISEIHESLIYSVYFAPRGKRRILQLGHQMAHSAEDITGKILIEEFELEKRVLEVIESDIEISYNDEHSIIINNEIYKCTEPRIHVHSSSEIKDFNKLGE